MPGYNTAPQPDDTDHYDQLVAPDNPAVEPDLDPAYFDTDATAAIQTASLEETFYSDSRLARTGRALLSRLLQ